MTEFSPISRALRRPMVARDAGERHRASTPLELLVDLCFVVAVAQAAAELHHGLTAGHVAHAVVGYGMVFFAIWWAWMNFTWFASAYDTDDVPYRLLTLVQMVGALVIAAGVPDAFNDENFTAVTVGYAVMRLGLVGQWLRAAAGHPAGRTVALRYASGLLLCQVAWIGRLALPDSLGLALFLPLVVLELFVPIWAERGGPATSWHPEHIAERYGLFTLIVLGESILAATTAVQGAFLEGGLSFGLVGVGGGGLLMVFSLWWLYFDHSAAEKLRLSPESAFLWGYGHFAVFASIAGLGAGLQVAADAGSHAVELSEAGVALAVAIPVVVATLMFGVFRAWGQQRWAAVGPFALAAVGVLAAASLTALLPLPLTVTFVGLVLAALVTRVAVLGGHHETPSAPADVT